MLENFEVLAGVVGPDSLADVTQQAFHNLINVPNKQLSQTWKTQLKNEPGLVVTYERKWRVWQSSFFGFETDAIPEAGITAGNVLTYGEAGVMFRVGRDLGVDYGPARARPSISGTPWFNGARITRPARVVSVRGRSGRAVARNIFLDGNTSSTADPSKRTSWWGISRSERAVFYKDAVKLDFTLTERSKEFKTQVGTDHFGAISLSFNF